MGNETEYWVGDNDFKNISDEIDGILKQGNSNTPSHVIQILQEANNVLTREISQNDLRRSFEDTIFSVDEFRLHKELLPEWYVPSALREAINRVGQRFTDLGISFPRKKEREDSQLKIVPKDEKKVVKLDSEVLQDVGSNTLA